MLGRMDGGHLEFDLSRSSEVKSNFPPHLKILLMACTKYVRSSMLFSKSAQFSKIWELTRSTKRHLRWHKASIGWKRLRKVEHSQSCCCTGEEDGSLWKKKSVIFGRLLLGSTIGQVSTSCIWRVPNFFNSKYERPKKLKLLAENWRLHLTFAWRMPKNKRCWNFRRNTLPPFLSGKVQHSAKEQIETWQIASLHKHEERAIEQTKHFHIFEKPLPSSLRDVANQTF